jgi:recombination associated protein RdgC
MWFKNLSVYRLTEPFALTSAELEQKLEPMRFKPCGSHDEAKFGWTAPCPESEQLVHSSNGFMMICGKKEEKLLPSSVVNEIYAEKANEHEANTGRRLSAKQRKELKEEIIFDLLPRAFSHSRKTYTCIDVKGGWVVVDSASSNKAEDLLSCVRSCLGSLPIVPLNTKQTPMFVMTEWLEKETRPAGIYFDEEVKLVCNDADGATAVCRHQDLSQPEIKKHLESGKQVVSLAMTWEERLSFVLHESLAVKRLQFLELVQSQVLDLDAETPQQRFDADFAIMTAELAEFLPKLVEWFGGLNG